jgi:cytidylate kinase
VIVAVDGPAGAGKSTVSRRLAERLGWLHLDTGAFYRAATLVVLRAGVDPDEGEAVLGVVEETRFRQENGRMLVDGEDVSTEIRSESATAAVSAVSAHAEVRRVMVRHQREWVAGHRSPVVVEGRDIGTVVFPDAHLKIWLIASSAERARRRAAETGDSQVEVEAELVRRDQADADRKASPQRPADDAIHLDTTNVSVEVVVERIVELLAIR